jgi:hypothetical protein
MKSIKLFKNELNNHSDKIFEISTDRIFEIITSDEENILKLFNFVKFSDNSSVSFSLLCRSNCLEIRNHKFYADFSSFNDFIYQFKKLYNELSGTASLGMLYEEDKIEITALKNGGILINCKINHYSDEIEHCDLYFTVDQTYLKKMVDEIDLIYEDLELI